jgi:hypothetical protein
VRKKVRYDIGDKMVNIRNTDFDEHRGLVVLAEDEDPNLLVSEDN